MSTDNLDSLTQFMILKRCKADLEKAIVAFRDMYDYNEEMGGHIFETAPAMMSLLDTIELELDDEYFKWKELGGYE